jgi:hypothetical protein
MKIGSEIEKVTGSMDRLKDRQRDIYLGCCDKLSIIT